VVDVDEGSGGSVYDSRGDDSILSRLATVALCPTFRGGSSGYEERLNLLSEKKDDETTVKVWVQWGNSLPRLGVEVPISEWDREEYREGWQRTVGLPPSPLSLGEAYTREEPVSQGQWPEPALEVLAAAWDLLRVRERVDEKNTMVDREKFDRLEALLYAIKKAAEQESA
jgi:hypothetical protein